MKIKCKFCKKEFTIIVTYTQSAYFLTESYTQAMFFSLSIYGLSNPRSRPSKMIEKQSI